MNNKIISLGAGALVLGGCSLNFTPTEADKEQLAQQLNPAQQVNIAASPAVTSSQLAQISAQSAIANQLFDDIYKENLMASPMRQTYMGIKQDYDKWDDISDSAAQQGHLKDIEDLNRLKEINPLLLDEQTKLSFQLFENKLKDSINDHQWRFHSYPVNQMRGLHSQAVSMLINAHKISNSSDAQAYIKRLHGLKPLMKQLTQNLRDREERGIMAPHFVYAYVINDSMNVLNGKPLQEIGVSTSGIDPRTIRIYGIPGGMLPEKNSDFRYDDLPENSIYISGEDDGVFNDNDYILFYSRGPDTWEVDVQNKTANHVKNIYSDKTYYFITTGGVNGKRISIEPEINGSPISQINKYDDFIFYEKENTNLFAVGQQWFGEDFNIENSKIFKINFPNIVPNSSMSVKVRGVAASALSSSMNIKANGQDLYTLSFSGISHLTLAVANESSKTIAASSLIDIVIDYNNGGNPSAKAYLDYIEIIGEKLLRVENNQFLFRNFNAATTTGIVEYQIQNAASISQVWNVTNGISPQSIKNQSSGNDFIFKSNGGSLKEYAVITNSGFLIPKKDKTNIVNQNLHSVKDINYLIITNSVLRSEAERIAVYHRENSGLTTQVVLVDEIYNEFSSGSKDITGIRDFIKHVYDTNSSTDRKLKYVSFFGDASYDFKDRISGNNNIIPAYQAYESFNLATSYVTDDYFGFLENNEGEMPLSTSFSNQTLDVATGRIPVTTRQQAKEVVDKILSYYNGTNFGDWRNTVTLVADDIDRADQFDNHGSERVLQEGMERIADSIKKNKPIFNINKIYAEAYKQETSSGGERYPQVNLAITNAIETGSLVFDYFGHGGEDGFASERILEKPQIQSFNNPKTLPLFITVTCEFSRFDNPNRITAGELVFWNKSGGTASMITTTREVFISTGQRFNQDLMKVLLEFNDEDLTIAETLQNVKNNFSDTQKYFIYYFGDPAMKLAIPQPNVRITKMNDVDITQSIDTLKALSKVRFEGIVTDKNNVQLNNYNGTLSTTIFDKPIDVTTLGQNEYGITMTYDSQISKLFKGKSSVKKGVFQFDFVVPKDIKIAYGKGKLSFYAENKVDEKSGANFDIVVGGINSNAPEDTTGPEVQVFMNDESFLDGGSTNSSPNLVVNLSDANGINTSITAVDHDIVAILDGDQANPIVLNDFYETELDDYTKGKVNYQLRDLAPGNHTIKIKAWDTYNNSSEATLNFVVVSDAGLTLNNVLNYPNPFVNYTEFWFNHNKPNDPLEVQIQIFTISGKLVKTINQNITTTGTLSRSINWNGLDDFGNKIGKGVYVYKLKVKSTSSNLSAEKYEKLVILQ